MLPSTIWKLRRRDLLLAPRGRWSWASSTSRPTASPTAADSSTPPPPSPTPSTLVAAGGRPARRRRRIVAARRRAGRARRGAAPRPAGGPRLSRGHDVPLSRRHDQGGGRRRRPRRRGARRQRHHRAAGDPAMAAVVAPARGRRRADAHAGHAADDAAEPALRRRRRRGAPPSWRRGCGRRSKLGIAEESRSRSIPASASARRRGTTCGCWPGSADLGEAGSAGRSWACRARASWAGCSTARSSERLAASLAAACYALARGSAQILRVHDVAETRTPPK